MASVKQIADKAKQPRGGYINPKIFEIIVLEDSNDLNDNENIHGSIIGIVVDYLTRFIMNKDKKRAFNVSLEGAKIAEEFGKKGSRDISVELFENINSLNDDSIISACKLASFDVWKRNRIAAINSKAYDEINPDLNTIKNIRILVNRSLLFFEKYGPITKDGFTFESEDEEMLSLLIPSGGYTATVNTGDGDFLTKDTLWDFKVLKDEPSSKNTLQLLMYWIMGKHSGQAIFDNITKIGIFNPRLNKVYLLDMQKVPESVIKEVEEKVICY